VKITVIATGFTPESAAIETRLGMPAIRVEPRVVEAAIVMPRAPESAPEPPAFVPEPEPAPVPVPMVAAEPALDLDDLDTPAYLRQGRLLN
jgi:hypothetical protein